MKRKGQSVAKGRKPAANRQAGKREPNGRLSRDKELEKARVTLKVEKEQWETMSVAIEARNRIHKVPLAISRDQKAGSVVGRMVMTEELSVAQGDAATRYTEDVDSYRRAISSPRQPGAVDLSFIGGGGQGGPDHFGFVMRTKRRYLGERLDGRGGVMGAIYECQNSLANRGCNLFAALDYMVLRDQYFSHMTGDLRIALNALSRHYGMLSKEEMEAA